MMHAKSQNIAKQHLCLFLENLTKYYMVHDGT